jgi:hypothetical protein
MLVRLFNWFNIRIILLSEFEMAQEAQFNYNFLNATITYCKGYLLDKEPNMRPKERILLN